MKSAFEKMKPEARARMRKEFPLAFKSLLTSHVLAKGESARATARLYNVEHLLDGNPKPATAKALFRRSPTLVTLFTALAPSEQVEPDYSVERLLAEIVKLSPEEQSALFEVLRKQVEKVNPTPAETARAQAAWCKIPGAARAALNAGSPKLCAAMRNAFGL